MKEFEQTLIKKGYKRIIGLDEAGRGPVAGPVVVAGVILDMKKIPKGINDSKKLSKKKREELFSKIFDTALFVGVSFVSEETIDRINILKATLKGFREVIRFSFADYALLDAVKLSEEIVPSLSIIKGDQKSVSIAAASIVAKVMRDRYMKRQEKLFPGFSFSKHKGYLTKTHQDELIEHGFCKIHRLSFEPVKTMKALNLKKTNY